MTSRRLARQPGNLRATRKAWPGALLLGLAALAVAIGQCRDSRGQAAPAADIAAASAPAQAADAAPALAVGAPAADSAPHGMRIPLDLATVDHTSPAFLRFKSWVDDAVAGNPGYAFAASDAALLFRLTQARKYCMLAIAMVEAQVADAEHAIASGGRPTLSGDSYLQVGPMIADLSLTMDSCRAHITPRQLQRWSAYAQQGVWNVWHHDAARWGRRAHPWSGWATANPGNNYYYSFVQATLLWALASGDNAWMDDLRKARMPPLQRYFAALAGGGSREGTGYGVAQMQLFSLYKLWRDATGEDLANANPHAGNSIRYWVHATVPTLDRFAPIGDQARVSVPELYDYHRRLMLEARQVSNDAPARAMAAWWLGNSSVPRMRAGFNLRYDLLPAGSDGAAPAALHYLAEGSGHLFARSSWRRDATWLAFVAGPYTESHAHQDQGAFTLFAGDWLAVTENIWSHSGIQQGTEVHNVVRFERADARAAQCQSPGNDRIVHQCAPTTSRMTLQPGAGGALTASADLTAAYAGNPALHGWRRRIAFSAQKLRVEDDFALAAGTRAIFQVNLPGKPEVSGQQARAGRLRIRVLKPADAVLRVHNWRDADAREFRSGWRLDITGGQDGYLVELDVQPL